MKRFFVGLLVGLILATAAAAYSENPVKLFVNGQEIKTDVPPQVINDRVMVPVRFIADALGARVLWNNNNSSVYIASPIPLDNTEFPKITGPADFTSIIFEGLNLIKQNDIPTYTWIIKNIKEITYGEDIVGTNLNFSTKTCYLASKDFENVIGQYNKRDTVLIYLGILANEVARVQLTEVGYDKMLNNDDKEAICNLVRLRTMQRAGGTDSDLSVRFYKNIVSDKFKPYSE